MDFGSFICEMERRIVWARRRLKRDRLNRSASRVLLASELGIIETHRVPDCMIRANGTHNPRHIDGPPGRIAHNCMEIPAYHEIQTVVDDLAAVGNRARRLRAHGLIIEDPAAPRLNLRIRGVCRILWLWALWQGQDVAGWQGGPQLRPRWYHPDDVKGYWSQTWRACGDGTHHADALHYLDRLCVAWSGQTGKTHAGERFHAAAVALLESST